MKHKKITKKQAREFLVKLKEKAEELGFQPFPRDPDYPTYNMNGDKMWAMTVAGIYVLNVPEPSDIQLKLHSGKIALWFTGRFLLTNHPMLPRDAGYTGKWNFHGYDVEQAIERFEERMKLVDVRSPDVKEKSRFLERENIRMQEISRQRKNVVDLTTA